MNAIIVLLIIDTIAQLVVCKFSLWWVISVVCRMLFCFRIIGATFKVRKLVIGEGVAFGAMFIWDLLFKGSDMPWLTLLLYLVMSLVAVGLMLLDDILYVYVIEDADD